MRSPTYLAGRAIPARAGTLFLKLLKMKKGLTLLLILSLISCNKLENKLQGGWLIEKAYYNNKP